MWNITVLYVKCYIPCEILQVKYHIYVKLTILLVKYYNIICEMLHFMWDITCEILQYYVFSKNTMATI